MEPPLSESAAKKVSQKGKSPEKFVRIQANLRRDLRFCKCLPLRGLMAYDYAGGVGAIPAKNRVLELAKRCFRPLSHLTKVLVM
jgi:hypothetical protein